MRTEPSDKYAGNYGIVLHGLLHVHSTLNAISRFKSIRLELKKLILEIELRFDRKFRKKPTNAYGIQVDTT